MVERLRHLGYYSDWPAVARRSLGVHATAEEADLSERVRSTLGFRRDDEEPHDVRVDRRWERDGVSGEEVSWSVGYGPRTRARVLKPLGETTRLPGVLALHSHDALKFHGLEKIADGPADPHPSVVSLRATAYGGRAFANELAKQGFVVLAHDVFLWGSRRFDAADMPDEVRFLADLTGAPGPRDEVRWYDSAAWHHEHVVEKYCRLLGTTLAGVVASEDRIAVNYLASREDADPGAVGCVGLSGGGCRAALLQATCDRISAAVIVAMMSRYEDLLDGHVAGHTWMFLPSDWPRHGDWPDLAACRAPSPLLVQYNRDDELFTRAGMQAAHRELAAHYAASGDQDAYTGEFYDGPHKFDAEMQKSAFDWLGRRLAAVGS